MSINGFYGGRQGQNFYISQVFDNFTAMMEDLSKGYSSSIGFGEYVMINYGAPVGYGFTCNITINTEEDNNLDEVKLFPAVNFKNNVSLLDLQNNVSTTDTIKVILDYVKDQGINITEVSSNNSNMVSVFQEYFEVFLTQHYSNNHQFLFTFSFTDDSVKNLAIDQEKNYANYNNTIWKKISGSEKTEGKIQHFVSSENISTNGIGYELITYLGGNIPTITVNTNDIDADLEPSISYSQPTIDNPHFTFNLPHRQVFVEDVEYEEYIPLENSTPTTQIVYENKDNKNVSINNPQLKIHLPRDIKFWSDDEEIDQQIKNNGYVLPYIDDTSEEEIIPKLTITGKKDYGNEDYYIHADTAYIYKVINATLNSFDLQYIGKLVQRAPDGWTTNTLTAFAKDEHENYTSTLNTFSIENLSGTNHEWILQFNAPEPVSFGSPRVQDVINPLNTPKVEQIVGAEDGLYHLLFSLPRAPKWEAEKGEPSSIIAGDYYLDTETGKVYKYDEQKGINEIANLTGPQGTPGAGYFMTDTLKCKVDSNNNLTFVYNGTTINQTLGTNSAEIAVKTWLNDQNFNLTDNAMLAVEISKYNTENQISSFVSYIYYTINKSEWTYVQASGEASSVETTITGLNFMFDGGLLSEDEE